MPRFHEVPEDVEKAIRADERARLAGELTGEASDNQEPLTIEQIRGMSESDYLARKNEVDNYLATNGYAAAASEDE